MPNIAVIGDIYTDIQTGPLTRLPQWDSDVQAKGINILTGGSASNTSRYLGLLGVSTRLFGALGDDNISEMHLKQYKRENLISVDRSVVRIPGNTSPTAIVMFDNKNRCFISNNGCLQEFSASHIDSELLMQYDHVHIGGYFVCFGLQTPSLVDLLQKVRNKGITVSMDCQFDAEMKWTGRNGNFFEVLPLLDVFMPSECEAKGVTNTDSIEEAMVALEKLMPKGLVIIKNGENGAFVRMPNTKGDVVHIKAFPAESVDTTGAGDAFDAGFLSGFVGSPVTKDNVIKAVRFGCGMASLCVRKAGAFIETISSEQIKQVLQIK